MDGEYRKMRQNRNTGSYNKRKWVKMLLEITMVLIKKASTIKHMAKDS